MRTLEAKVVAITGAGSGIGRALAIACAELGAEVALADVNEAGLEETRRLVAGARRASVSRVDVADRAAVFRWADRVRAEHGGAHVVVNNAGVSLSARVAEMSAEDFDGLLRVNLGGVVAGTQAFLPGFLAQREGHVVNVSSVFGIVGVPTQSAYCASKFAVRGFTESLRQELVGTGVHATCIHPGGVRTNIVRGGKHHHDIGGGDADHAALVREFDRVAGTSPTEAARQIVRGVLADAPRVLVGRDARAMDGLARAIPGAYDRVMGFALRHGRRFVRVT
jgi:NAD(P)-dependent dehydrogenase (short-subunit alcohol dehydrogenase family)